ncbi:unnamed protein product [Plutella xylostella]|uniref:(diamondback moth) hypothetical protein n=1 Tax=Plutella xylostella TaxID=51655 RepID=A0A8S4G5P2_PLUXY|nr:unnamed protein product [Plutella xylostella]
MKPDTVLLGFRDEARPMDFFREPSSPYKTDEFDLDNGEVIFPIRNNVSARLSATEYVQILSDVLTVGKNLCLCRNFHKLDMTLVERKVPSLKYIDVWLMSLTSVQSETFTVRALFALQLAAVVRSTRGWKRSRMRVFATESTSEFPSPLEESSSPPARGRGVKERLEELLKMLRINAETHIQGIKLWSSLYRRGISSAIVRIIQSLYEGSTCRVIHDKELGAPINITAGVKQGCLLSPLLFIIVLDDVMRDVTTNVQGISWGVSVLEDLDYADDIVLISPTLAQLEGKLEKLQTAAGQMGLRINRQKTVDMRVNPTETDPLVLDNESLQSVPRFVYLGSTITSQGGADEDVAARINKAKAAFAQLRSVWDSNVLKRRVKISLFNSVVKSVLLFGCETWRVTKGLMNQIQVFVNKSLRSILRIFWPNTIRNADLWKVCKQSPIEQEIALRKWRWIGHTIRKGADNMASIAFEWKPLGGHRRRGRPVHTWRRTVDGELRAQGLSWTEARAVAEDRTAWRTLVKALCTTGVPDWPVLDDGSVELGEGTAYLRMPDAYLQKANSIIRRRCEEGTAVTFVQLPAPPVIAAGDHAKADQYLRVLDEFTRDLSPTILVRGLKSVTSTTL